MKFAKLEKGSGWISSVGLLGQRGKKGTLGLDLVQPKVKGNGTAWGKNMKRSAQEMRNPSLIPQTRKIIGLGQLQTIQLACSTFPFALKCAQIFKMKRVHCFHVQQSGYNRCKNDIHFATHLPCWVVTRESQKIFVLLYLERSLYKFWIKLSSPWPRVLIMCKGYNYEIPVNMNSD